MSLRFHLPEHKRLVHELIIDVRWGDMDAMGHVNNTIYLRYFEMVRIDWLKNSGGVFDENGCGPVIVNAFLNFIRPVEFPGQLLARHFVGQAGRLLDNMLAAIGLKRGEDVYIANAVKCRPPHNRTPERGEIAACLHFLDAQVELVGPRVIVPLGNTATRRLLDTREGITVLRGRRFPYRDGIMLVPTLHPAAVLRGGAPAMTRAREDFAAIKAVLDGGTGGSR